MIFAEGTRGNIAGNDRCFDVRIVGRIADGDGEIAGAEFDVLATGDVLDGDVAGGNSCVEFGISRNADFDVEVITWTAGDVKFGAARGISEVVTEIFDFVFVSAGDIDGELSIFGADDADSAGTDVQRDPRSGGKLRFKMRDAAFGDFSFIGGADGKGAEDQGKTSQA